MRVLEPKINPRVTYQRLLLNFSETVANELIANNRSNLDCFKDYVDRYVGALELDAIVAADLLFSRNNYHNIATILQEYGEEQLGSEFIPYKKTNQQEVVSTGQDLETLFLEGGLTNFLTALIERSLIPLLNAYVYFTKQKGRFTAQDLFDAQANVLDFMTTKSKPCAH